MNNEKLIRFINLLESVFELDKADLDFGIYRIMNIRRDEIKQFLSIGLPKKVKETLEPFAADTGAITARIVEIEKQAADIGIEITASPKLSEEYNRLKSQLAAGVDLSSIETDVYSALYSFFNRYYDEGDFISKRRYKESVYAIPYEGEEVKLYWANADQYYIKTAENFRDYTFVDDGKKVHFRLVGATTEKNNNKESDTSKRVFMLYTEAEERPDIKAIEEVDGELIIRFVYDVPTDKNVKYAETNLATIIDAILKQHKNFSHLLAPASQSKKESRPILEKHLVAYVAKNTFDYFIHKDLRGFLSRELDFFIKSEVIHLDDIDTTDEKRAGSYLAKVRAIKHVGKIIIDFLAQIEDFQKKLWLKKKFVVETNWCITLDRVDESFYPEIISNTAQLAEWRDMYAIDEIQGDLAAVPPAEPLTVKFLRQNTNLVLDTRHFTADFKGRLVASIDNLDEQTGGLLIQGDNIQALQLLGSTFKEKIDCFHIDPPYNTDTSGFLYKNNYRHSSWMSMMSDRLQMVKHLMNRKAVLACHIDENEYERLWLLLYDISFSNLGTLSWDKRNAMTGGKGVATQHEYVTLSSNSSEVTVNLDSKIFIDILEKARFLIAANGGKVDAGVRKKYGAWLKTVKGVYGGEIPYKYIDDKGAVYQSVSLRAPEKRTDPKFFIPLIHPVTGKPCPVPPNGFSRAPETIQKMLNDGDILFGSDETIQPRQKSRLTPETEKQMTSVLQNGEKGKADVDKLGLQFPYCHPVSMYESIIGALMKGKSGGIMMDFFAGSGTSAHAIININRVNNLNRKYILVEMGDYFNTVTLPRVKKVVYSADWKNGKPQNRDTGVSHIMKYIKLESYEDALSNIELDDGSHQLHELFGEEYLLRYMFNTEEYDSLLQLDAFALPFGYKMNINENNETKDQIVDLCETFNYLLGLSVIRQSEEATFHAVPDPHGEYENAVKLERDDGGEYGFKQIEGRLPDGKRALIIWRTVTKDLLKSNAALDAYFAKHRINPADREFDVIYVNCDNNLENLRLDDDNWKVQRIEPVFKSKMFEEAE